MELLDYIPVLGYKELAGSYCVKDGTEYSESADKGTTCTVSNPDAVPPETPGDCGYFTGPN